MISSGAILHRSWIFSTHPSFYLYYYLNSTEETSAMTQTYLGSIISFFLISVFLSEDLCDIPRA